VVMKLKFKDIAKDGRYACFSNVPFLVIVRIEKRTVTSAVSHRTSSSRSGVIGLIPEEPEDMWHAYNLIQVGDHVRSTTVRRVQSETSSGKVVLHGLASSCVFTSIRCVFELPFSLKIDYLYHYSFRVDLGSPD